MSAQQKRYRQYSILELGFTKKPKIHGIKMNESSKVGEFQATAAKNSPPCSSMNNDMKLDSQGEDKVVLQDSDSEESLPSLSDLFPDETEEHNAVGEDSKTDKIESLPSSANSSEIFSKSTYSEAQELFENHGDSWEEVQLSFLNRSPDCDLPLPKLEPLENHSIMFSPYIRAGVAPRPYPSSYQDKWDCHHIRMPCSPLNRYPVEDMAGNKQIRSRWDLICRSLSSNIESSNDLEAAIMRYNSQYAGRWNFRGLHAFLNKYLFKEEREHFFETVLPEMIKMALDLPNICTQPIPLLKKEKDHYITLSQKQIGCLLLNAFFCTFPRRTLPSRRNKQRFSCEYATYPDINFNRLFAATNSSISAKNAEKLKCLINYFRRIISKEPCGTVTFHRQYRQDLPRWHGSNCGIRAAIIKSDGLIESEGHGMLQVDFANKYVGGGILGCGCVQEEIRFIICPELIVSRLFVECLGSTETLIVTGVEQYNKYSGYSDTFKWEGNFQDQTPRDSWGRRCTELVAMDALHFTNMGDQYKLLSFKRELNKAFCGFYKDSMPANLPAVATGNWGCGAFKGNPSLKFLIQLMAASVVGRSMLYFTFGNKNLKKELKNMYKIISDKNIRVGELWSILLSYCSSVKVCKQEVFPPLSDYIFSVLSNKKETSNEQRYEDSEETIIDDSDKIAIKNLIKAVDDDSTTETEES